MRLAVLVHAMYSWFVIQVLQHTSTSTHIKHSLVIDGVVDYEENLDVKLSDDGTSFRA